jgi:hypothetical protein
LRLEIVAVTPSKFEIATGSSASPIKHIETLSKYFGLVILILAKVPDDLTLWVVNVARIWIHPKPIGGSATNTLLYLVKLTTRNVGVYPISTPPFLGTCICRPKSAGLQRLRDGWRVGGFARPTR